MNRHPLAAAFTSLLLSLSLFAPASDAPAAQGPTPPQAGGPAPARQQQPPLQPQADMKNLAFGSHISLGTGFPPGEYVLQVIVTDALAREKQETATQWIDFRVVE